MLRYSKLSYFFAFCLLPGFSGVIHGQNVACSIQQAPSDAAAKAFAQENYTTALQLYADAVKKNPQDFAAIVGQERTLLKMNVVDAAAKLAETNADAHPNDALFAATLGEVRFRQGDMKDAAEQYGKAMKLNPCLARLHYDLYVWFWTRAMYATGYAQLVLAHQLMPDDPEIGRDWTGHLPLRKRTAALDTELAKGANGTVAHHAEMVSLDERLHAILAEKNGGCRLDSEVKTTTLPLEYLLSDSDINQFQGLGFDVRFNDKASARLELDTGASGILINRVTAKKAGLVPIATDKINGIGDQGAAEAYWAYVDSFRIGALEFHNCLVEVSDKRSVVGIDGLIGANVFDDFHVTLDMPMRLMTLTPLPPRPGEITKAAPTLNAAGVNGGKSVAAGDSSSKSAAQPVAIRYHDRYVAPEMQGWMPFYLFGHEILLAGALKDKQPRLFLLDSGSNISDLSIRAAKSVGKIHSDSHYIVKGIDGKVKTVYVVDNADLVFANLKDPLRFIPVFDIDNISNNTGTEVSGIIGMDTLAMLIIDIDYRDGLIHLVFDPKHGTNVRIR
ncbi:MAG TPA: aspartyl protease family protein [Acidobacteriaceae bacterium]|jgi:predicted aspartyl protease|nr:aspartyl protease family protein [Acidobacteriaceae bacterium]